MRRAVDYIETHLAADHRCRHRVSERDGRRSLEQGFHEELNCTPSAYMHDRRLDRARLDLMETSPIDHLTVTDVAIRWGFTHLGRFANTYR